MTMQCAYRLNITAQPSRLAYIWINTVHALASVSIAVSAISLVWQVILMLMVITNWCREWRQLSWRTNEGFQLRFAERMGWEWVGGGGYFQPVVIEASSWSSSLVVVIHLRHAKGVIRYPLFCDALTRDEFRRLRVTLRTSFNHKRLELDI